ncbi:MAG: DNA repair protein RecO [Candidatus Roizmanbacteria bacterium]|nr:MAG: DNA repair protein RecO [Candidatus Roizmanbacteria bacterium]
MKKKSLLGKDTIITLFTKEEGKTVVVAKGIKKITSRRAPHLQTGNLINVILSNFHERYYLQESQLISAFSTIKSKQQKIDYQYLLFFVLDRLLPERQKEKEIYFLTKNFLVELSQKDFNKQRLLYYLNRLLSSLGYYKSERSYPDVLSSIEEIIHEKIPSSII